jgi:general secretion pathway protein G
VQEFSPGSNSYWKVYTNTGNGFSTSATNWTLPEGGYLDRMPKDPWDRPYVYENPGKQSEFDIYSLGRDGQPGGDGPDADVGNWDLD